MGSDSKETGAAEVEAGTLYVVATPLGNLGDLSPRARRVLAEVDCIACEDTRTSSGLLRHFGIETGTVSLHEHNESERCAALIRQLQSGGSIALISDAGTPLVSDPGFVLVRAAREAGCRVLAVPGPCAAIAALSVAGIASDAFVFVGFLAPKSKARREQLQALAGEARTVIAYESSHRIVERVHDLAEVFGKRSVALVREISKRFEDSVRCPAADLPVWLAADPNRRRGEFVLVIEGAPEVAANEARVRETLTALLEELPPARAARVAARLTGWKRNDVYAVAMLMAGEA